MNPETVLRKKLAKRLELLREHYERATKSASKKFISAVAVYKQRWFETRGPTVTPDGEVCDQSLQAFDRYVALSTPAREEYRRAVAPILNDYIAQRTSVLSWFRETMLGLRQQTQEGTDS